MSKALRTRIRSKLVSLIENSGTHKLARMASFYQSIAVAGLHDRRPKTSFDLVFTSHPDFLENHERLAGVNKIVPNPSLDLDFGKEGVDLLRRMEDLADLPEEHRQSCHISDCADADEGEEPLWPHEWLECLMDDSPAVDDWVRRALVRAIDDDLLADIEEEIECELEQIAEERCQEV